MKRSVVVMLIGLLIPLSLNAEPRKVQSGPEETKTPSTRLESFLSKKGVLYIKDFYHAGKITGNYGTSAETKALIVCEPGKNKNKMRGLQITITSAGRLDRESVSFLDVDEADSLSSAIAYMIDLNEQMKLKEREYTEIIFSTKGDFQFGFFQSDGKVTVFASSGRISQTNAYFDPSTLNEFKSMIDKGIVLAKNK